MNFETLFIEQEISKCEDLEELRERVFPMIRTQQDQWAKKIKEIIAQSKLTKSKFAELTGVSRVTVNKWCNGSIPKSRETFLRIGLVAGFYREQMNQLLQRYGRYPALYVKSLEDCVCVFVMQNGYEENTKTKNNYILNRIKDNIGMTGDVQSEDFSTVSFDEKLSDIRDETALERFIAENSRIFEARYHKFYAYVKMHIRANYESFGGTVFELAIGQGWSSSLKQCVSAIRQGKWYPTRNKIISLGLHLSMDHEQINKMLELAYMEPLCAKNVFESVIIFILEDAALSNMLDQESEEFDPDELYMYARDILKELDLPEVESFITELSETDDEW